MTTLLEKWSDAVENKNSVLCAGLDPAEFEMGRGEDGLPKGAFKLNWSLRYLEAVAPFAAAIKPNVQYWKDSNDMDSLMTIVERAHDLGLVVIDDSKLADIGDTNDAGIYHAKKKGFDAVTLAPFAGNMEEAVKQAKKRDIGIITMCLMSNPDYEREKNQWIEVDENDYHRPDVVHIGNQTVVRKYIQLAHAARAFGLDGIVIGAPSAKNHIQEEEIAKARSYAGNELLVLVPGLGKQEGEVQSLWKYFDADKAIINVGRLLMLPGGKNTTPELQMEIAKYYQKTLNELRRD